MYILGFLYASLVEWAVHKYLFHGLGKKKDSIFAFHIREHHKNCLANGNHDTNFTLRENIGILFLVFLHLPMLYIWPMFFWGLVSYGVNFIIIHKLVHIKVAWGKKLAPWHWDHHMRYQNHNFNVVLPVWDYAFGTRKKILDKT